jgi:hypothetical protein
MFGPAQRYAMVMDGLKAARLPNASHYLLTPDKAAPPPGPDPIKMGELQVKKQLADAAQTQAQAAGDKNQKLLAIDSERINVDKAKLKLTAMDHDRTNDRHDLETAAKIDIGQREIKLLEEAPPAAEKAIVAPRN